MAGLVGEYAFCHAVEDATRDPTYDWDVLMNGAKIDIKTKIRQVSPITSYSGTVNTLNGKQKCDYYAFVSVDSMLTSAHLAGYIPADMFFRQATFIRKGDADGDNGFVAKCDMYNLAYSELYTIRELM